MSSTKMTSIPPDLGSLDADGSVRRSVLPTPQSLHWSSPLFETATLHHVTEAEGWFIQRLDSRRRPIPNQFLQIATGNWCRPEHATRFPCRSGAAAYVREYGLRLRRTAAIVRPVAPAGECREAG